MKRAQIYAQVLMYALSMIITAMVLLFGYQALAGLQRNAELAKMITLKQDLKTEITSFGNKYESVRTKDFKIPSQFTEVCFLDINNPNALYTYLNSALKYRYMYEYISDLKFQPELQLVPKNVFFCPPCTDGVYSGNITVYNPGPPPYPDNLFYKCFSSKSGSIKITMKGLGRQTEIS